MIKKISSKVVYQNKWLSVTEDQVEFPNGHKGIYGVVHKDPCGVAIPFKAGKFTLVKLYRYPTQKYGWEFPMGGNEEDPEMLPEEIVKAELREETGLIAESVEFLGKLYFANGFSNQAYYVYFMTQLTQVERALEITEDIEVKEFTLAEVDELIKDGEIEDGPTVSALHLLRINKPELFS